MSAPPVDLLESVSTSGHEDGLGRRTLIFDRESGEMLERLHVRPELAAFEEPLRERMERLSQFDDKRFARVRSVERDPLTGGLTVISEFVPGNRVSDLLEAAASQPAEDATSPSVDAALGFLLEILPALAALQGAAGFAHGAVAPERIVLTSAGEVVLLDSLFGHTLQRLQFNRRRLWSEFHIAMPPAAGPARFDIAADLGQAALTAVMIVVGRPLHANEYPEGLEALLTEVVEIAEIRGSSADFAAGLQRFLQRTLPLPTRKAYSSSDEAATDLRQLAREIGLHRCRSALTAFIAEMNSVRDREAAEEAAREIVAPEIEWTGEEPASFAQSGPELTLRVDEELADTILTVESETDEFTRSAEADAEAVVSLEFDTSSEPATIELDTVAEPILSVDYEDVRERLAAIELESFSQPSAASDYGSASLPDVAPELEAVPEAALAIDHQEAAHPIARDRETIPDTVAAQEHESVAEPVLAVAPEATGEPVAAREEPVSDPWVWRQKEDRYQPAPPEPIAAQRQIRAERTPTPEPRVDRSTDTGLEHLFTGGSSHGTSAPLADTTSVTAHASGEAQTARPEIPPVAAAIPEVKPQPEEATSGRRRRRGSKADRDKLRSNAPPPPPASVFVPQPVIAPPITTSFGNPSEPVWQAPPLAPVAPPPIVPTTPAPITLRLKAEPPSGFTAPAHTRVERREARDVDALPYTQRRDSEGGASSFPWKLAAAAVVVIAVGVGAARTYWPVRGAQPKGATTAASKVAAPAAPTGTNGSLILATEPSGAKVLVDGKAFGETPITIWSLAAGRHTLTLVTPSGTVKKTIRIDAGKALTLEVPIYSGWLALFAPIPLDIAENGRAIGSTEQGRLMLTPGRHVLTFSSREFGYSTVQAVDIEPGEERSITVQPRGELNLNAMPWAEVWIDGQKTGETPIANLQVPLGTHEIVFKHPQFGERRMTTVVKANAPSALSVDFSKNPQ